MEFINHQLRKYNNELTKNDHGGTGNYPAHIIPCSGDGPGVGVASEYYHDPFG
jgi:hypothetical protein